MTLFLLTLLALLAAGLGTVTGFGLSTIMVPVVALFFPLPATLLFVGLVHLASDLWKILLFWPGREWRLLVAFGLPGLVFGLVGGTLAVHLPTSPLQQVFALFLLVYVAWTLWNRNWKVPSTWQAAATGGALSGLLAGMFGVGGAVRSAFLIAFDLPKIRYVFVSGAIALVIDLGRLSAYLAGDIRLPEPLLAALLPALPASLAGAWLARRFLRKVPQERFRQLIALFLGLVALKLLFPPGG